MQGRTELKLNDKIFIDYDYRSLKQKIQSFFYRATVIELPELISVQGNEYHNFILFREDTKLLHVIEEVELNVTERNIYVRYETTNHSLLLEDGNQELFGIPNLIEWLIHSEYICKDRQLEITDQITKVTENNVDDVTDIFNTDTLYSLPAVLIPYGVIEKFSEKDLQLLGKYTAGYAHVYYPENEHVERVIEEVCDLSVSDETRAVALVEMQGEVHSFSISAIDLSDLVSGIIQLNNVSFAERPMKDRLLYSSALSFQEELNKTKAQLVMANSLIRSLTEKRNKDASSEDPLLLMSFELEHVKKELEKEKIRTEKLETENEELKDKYQQALRKAESMKNTSTAREGRPLLVYGSEQEMYSGEIKSIILDSLRKALENTESSGDGKNNFRRYDVLNSVYSANTDGQTECLVRNKKKQVEDTLYGTDDIGKIIKGLEKMGFTVENSGSGHYKIRYGNDDRYIFILPATTSDFRSFRNAATTIKKKYF